MKSRFCPSPTGLIHLGNTRTALFNDLAAKKEKGIFLLRIEDTDKDRSEDRFVQSLMKDLRWLEMNWQEGAEIGGEHEPYFQSERQKIYDKYYMTLIEKDLAYPCFCSEEQLAVARKVQRAAGRPPRYSGTCLSLSDEEKEAKLIAGEKPTLRFHVPEGQTIVFTDLVKGEQRFASNDIGDFIIRRANGTAPFLYCNAIDDALMNVTTALRGEDHLTNTPRQLMILEALGLTPPRYGHISLILGSDGSPLSKRNGSLSVKELSEQGYLPIAVNNYLARLGHYFADNSLMSLEELAIQFSYEHLSQSPARFDEAQLDHWQKEAILQLSHDEALAWMQIDGLISPEKRDLFVESVKPNCVFPSDAKAWVTRCFGEFEYDETAVEIIKKTNVNFFEEATNALADNKSYDELVQTLKEKCDVKGKGLFQPLRIVMSGQLKGPEMNSLFELIGVEKLKQRFELALTRYH